MLFGQCPDIARICAHKLRKAMKRLSKKFLVNLEIYGMAFILLSAGWEIFFESKAKDFSQDNAFYRVEKKIDETWNQIGSIQDQINPEGERSGVVITYNEASSR